MFLTWLLYVIINLLELNIFFFPIIQKYASLFNICKFLISRRHSPFVGEKVDTK